MHPRRSSFRVGSFLQPLLVDLLALLLGAEQASWHVNRHQTGGLGDELSRLAVTALGFADAVGRRLVLSGVPADARPGTVATTTGVPECDFGFVDEDKTVAVVIDQIDAATARVGDALAALERADDASRDLLLDILRELSRHRARIASLPPPQDRCA